MFKIQVCDKPGGWLCRGQYPPALHKLIAKRKNFAQLEDFNTKYGDLPLPLARSHSRHNHIFCGLGGCAAPLYRWRFFVPF